MAGIRAARIWGTTWLGVTRLMFWQPMACNSSMIAANSWASDLPGWFTTLADAVVLAETAAEITAGEEDGAGAMNADQRLFFTEMRAIAGNSSVSSSGAQTGCSPQSVDLATTGAEGTAFQHPSGGFSPLVEAAAGVKGMGSNGHEVCSRGKCPGQGTGNTLIK